MTFQAEQEIHVNIFTFPPCLDEDNFAPQYHKLILYLFSNPLFLKSHILNHIMADVNEGRTMDEKVFEAHRSHTSGVRIHTDSAISHAILEQFPKHCVTSTKCDLIKYAEAGQATIRSVKDGPPLLLSRDYEPTMWDNTLRDGDSAGILTSRIYFGCYDYIWREHEFRIYIVNAQDSLAPAANDRRTYIVSQPADHEIAGRSISAAADALIVAAGVWMEKSGEEVWVCDQASWQKDRQLWLAVRNTKFDDIIGDEARKVAIGRDTLGFFDAREQYKEYGVPWKVRALSFSLIRKQLID